MNNESTFIFIANAWIRVNDIRMLTPTDGTLRIIRTIDEILDILFVNSEKLPNYFLCEFFAHQRAIAREFTAVRLSRHRPRGKGV